MTLFRGKGLEATVAFAPPRRSFDTRAVRRTESRTAFLVKPSGASRRGEFSERIRSARQSERTLPVAPPLYCSAGRPREIRPSRELFAALSTHQSEPNAAVRPAPMLVEALQASSATRRAEDQGETSLASTPWWRARNLPPWPRRGVETDEQILRVLHSVMSSSCVCV